MMNRQKARVTASPSFIIFYDMAFGEITGSQEFGDHPLGGLHDIFIILFWDCSHCRSQVAGPLFLVGDELQLWYERFEIERIVEYFDGL
jgi:hypothetical protein